MQFLAVQYSSCQGEQNFPTCCHFFFTHEARRRFVLMNQGTRMCYIEICASCVRRNLHDKMTIFCSIESYMHFAVYKHTAFAVRHSHVSRRCHSSLNILTAGCLHICFFLSYECLFFTNVADFYPNVVVSFLLRIRIS